MFLLRLLFILIIFVHFSACGTLLYPERRHKELQFDPSSRQLDAGVVVMDAACLVFFVIPGVVAFIVDFASGAIYLPSGEESIGVEKKLSLKDSDLKKIEEGVFEISGLRFDMKNTELRSYLIEPEN